MCDLSGEGKDACEPAKVLPPPPPVDDAKCRCRGCKAIIKDDASTGSDKKLPANKAGGLNLILGGCLRL